MKHVGRGNYVRGNSIGRWLCKECSYNSYMRSHREYDGCVKEVDIYAKTIWGEDGIVKEIEGFVSRVR